MTAVAPAASPTPLPFSPPTMLAPMEGVTHPTFRQLLVLRPGVGIVCTEFVRITSEPFSPTRLLREVAKAPGVPLSVQVMGNDLRRMAEAAALVSSAGADVVDINLGCPSKNAARCGVGAAMLKDKALLHDVVLAVRQATPGVLSAKIRAGFDDATNVVSLARTVQDAGVDYLVVHPRRRVDFYEGIADWRIIRVLKDELAIPVVGNGDAWYAEDVARMRHETGCDGVMLGRPALRNPWIFEQALALAEGRAPIEPDGELIHAFIDEMARRFSRQFGKHTLGKLKEIVRYLARTLDDDQAFRTAALRSTSVDELVAVTERSVRALPASAFDLAACSKLGLERSGCAR